jgi:FeS assembly SUF system regulator
MIKLSRMADYGVLLMTELARTRDSLSTAPGMAANTGLPVPTVSKVLKLLAQDGLLESQRGIKGGYALARDAELITVADIIGAVEGPIALTDCVGDDGALCEIEALCPTRTNWSRINEAMISALGAVTLAEMALPAVDFNQMFPGAPVGADAAGAGD